MSAVRRKPGTGLKSTLYPTIPSERKAFLSSISGFVSRPRTLDIRLLTSGSVPGNAASFSVGVSFHTQHVARSSKPAPQ